MTDAPDLEGAICAQVDPELFFPAKGGDVSTPKQVCKRCSVYFGVWGGVSERQRRRMRQSRVAA